MNAIVQKVITKPILFLFLLTFVVYFSSFWNKFVWDDEQFIYKNEFAKNFDIKEIFTTSTTSGAGINSNYYRPLTTLSFAIDYQFWGLNEFGFHLTNTLLHALVGILLFLFLRELKLDKVSSLGIASLFIIHPLQTEAVTYINSRGDSLYSLFVMMGLLLFSLSLREKYIEFRVYDRKIIINEKKLIILSFASYVLAIFSKEIALVSGGLFFLILFIKAIESKNFKLFLKKNYKKIIFIPILLVASITYLFFRIKILHFSSTLNFYQENNFYTESLRVRLLTFSNSVWEYLKLIAVPYPLHMERTALIIDSINFGVVSIFVLLSAIIFLGIYEFKKTEKTWILFGLGWFICMMVPVSGIVPINGLFYEHWLYLPIIGIFLMTYGIYKLFIKKNYYVILFLYSLVLIFLTIRQNYLWAKPIRFYEYTLKYSQSARLYNNLGMAYADERNFEKAILNYQNSLKMNNSYPQIYHNLGNSYLSMNEIDSAEKYFLRALEVNSNFYYSFQPLINIYLYKEDYENAKIYIQKLLDLSPNNPQLIQLYNYVENKK